MNNTAAEYQIDATSTTVVELLPVRANRITMIVSAPATNAITLSLTQAVSVSPIDADVGITLRPGADPLILMRHIHGDLVTRQWTIGCGAGSESIGVVEILEDA